MDQLEIAADDLLAGIPGIYTERRLAARSRRRGESDSCFLDAEPGQGHPELLCALLSDVRRCCRAAGVADLDRDLLICHALLGSLREVAAIYEVTAPTVGTRVNSARRMLARAGAEPSNYEVLMQIFGP